MKSNTGAKSTRLQQLLLPLLFTKRSEGEVIIVHHVTDDTMKLQLEVERNCPINGLKFERVIL